jgi:CRP-like cAMP-binding protein
MALEDDMALLSRVALFRDMDRDALRLLAFSSELRNLRTGDTLFRKDDISEYSFVVASGTVALMDNDIVLSVLGPGTLIGEMALFTETRRPATAVAREPSTLLRLSRQIFRRTLEEYPETALRIAAIMRLRVKRLSVELATVKGRIRKIDTKP